MTELWRLLAGVVLFILGMNMLETSLQSLSGRKFKLFLRRQTAKPLTAAVGGAAVTGLLQSSSVVNLVVLALVGAGTLPMKNALAVVLGSNLGTTFDTWIVASVGFKFDIQAFATPLVGIAGIWSLLVNKEKPLHSYLSFMFGIGLLFFGLNIMQTSMEEVFNAGEISLLSGHPLYLYLAAGVAITAMIQSSSATVAIVLSALYAQAITLPEAAAMVLGSEVGTTLKLLIVAVNREASMKKVALGNLIFNAGTTIILFFFVERLVELLTASFGIRDPLIALALFQTSLNFVSLLIFFPLLKPIAGILDRIYANGARLTSYITPIPVEDSDIAIHLLEQETLNFQKAVISYASEIFEMEDDSGPHREDSLSLPGKTETEKYQSIKHLHGDIYAYNITLQQRNLKEEDTKRLDKIMSSVRNAMYAAKNIKDAIPDLVQLRNSANEHKYKFYCKAKGKAQLLIRRMTKLIHSEESSTRFADLVGIYDTVQKSYTETLNDLYKNDQAGRISEVDISTIINFNREEFGAFKSLVIGLKDVLLNEDQAKYFDDIPGFIR